MPTIHDPYAALRYRDYRCLLGGGVLASIGAEVQAIAVAWELWLRTRSPFILGMAGLAQFLPVLLFALPAGQAADRFSRKRLFQASQGAMLLAALGLAALSRFQGPVPLMLGCLFLAGLGRVQRPAALVPARAGGAGRTLANAVTWNSSGWQISNVTGPALGGLLIARSDAASTAYALSALCFLGCVLLLAPIQPRPLTRPTVVRSFSSLLAGVRFVWHTELLLAAITLDLFAVLLGGATALLPIYATDVLHVDARGLGWLRSAPALGALLMAMALAHRPPLHRPGRALLVLVAGFGLVTIVFGLSHNFALSFGMLALAGALDNVSVVVRGTLMQTLTPDEMRGRVSAVNSVFISSSNELGAFESGVTADWFGAVGSVVGGGVGTIVVVLLTLLRWPALARMGPLHSPPKSEPPTK